MRRKRGKPFGPPPGRREYGAMPTSNSPGTWTPPFTKPSMNGFSLKDEARNTAYHQSKWLRDARLREKPVAFVSAGVISPSQELPSSSPATPIPVEHSSEDLERKCPADGERVVEPTDRDAAAASGLLSGPRGQNDQPVGHVPSPPAETSLTFNLPGDTDLQKISPVPLVLGDDPPTSIGSSDGDDSDSSGEVIVFKGRRGDGVSRPQPVGSDDFQAGSRPITRGIPATIQHASDASRQSTPRRGEAARCYPSTDRAGEEDDVVADYVANMGEWSDGRTRHKFADRELGGPNDFLPDPTGVLMISPTSEEEPMPHDALNRVEGRGKDGDGYDSGPEGVDGPDDGEDGAIGNESDRSEDDDGDIDDETLARLLAKQEELGLGGDELLLSTDSHTVEGAYSVSRLGANRAFRTEFRTLERSDRLSAAVVADAFDDLDLMDWDRPSLQRRRKGRLGPPDFNVSDPELQAVLGTAWQRDRDKKKMRKLQREELRAKGLLRRGADPEDLRVKYPKAMTFEDIKTELKTFLIGSDETLQFPPMDNSARKMVHELANRFKIKSKSSGSGDQRRPVLYRTKGTLKYGEDHFEQATSRAGRKYFPRLDTKSKGTQRHNGGGGGVTYRDGDVVGASAPELGEGNKGRAMLQKMGWSTGMALGTSANQGILQPVAHVVKRTKAGLG